MKKTDTENKRTREQENKEKLVSSPQASPAARLLGLSTCFLVALRTYFLIFLFSCFLITCLYAEVSPEVYFNSGIDKYVKGDYDGAISLFEQTLSKNPNHAKAEKFLKKVLVEGAEKQIMESNSQKAKIYIEKAKGLFPDDAKVKELQKIIKGLPTKEIYKPVPETAKKTAPQKKALLPVSKDIEKPQQLKETVTILQEKDNFKSYFLTTGLFLFIAALSFLIWAKKKSRRYTMELEKWKDKIHTEEETKFKQELEKVKESEDEKLKTETAERTRIQMAEKKAATEKKGETAHKEFEATIEEDKILDTISDALKREDYSKKIIERMTISIKTIMHLNKKDAMENILRLSKSEQPRLRYDCVRIIDTILTADTFEILLELLNDDDSEVKKAAILSVNNICKTRPRGIPSDMVSEAQKQLTREKIRNGWII